MRDAVVAVRGRAWRRSNDGRETSAFLIARLGMLPPSDLIDILVYKSAMAMTILLLQVICEVSTDLAVLPGAGVADAQEEFARSTLFVDGGSAISLTASLDQILMVRRRQRVARMRAR